MARWRIQFIYQNANGETRITDEIVKSADRDGAARLAEGLKPSLECVYSVHPESNDQLLGGVRFQALEKAGKKWAPDQET